MSKIFKKSFNYKLIYVFRIKSDTHKGLLKIGDTTICTDDSTDRLPPNCKALNQEANKRIKKYTTNAGISFELLHTELAIKTIKDKYGNLHLKAFRDHQVHKVLINSGFKRKQFKSNDSQEWFEIDLSTVLKAIDAVKNNQFNLSASKQDGVTPIIFRPEQKEAIQKTLKQFETGNNMLWNAKMRFGKTLSALEVVKQLQFSKTIIITHRPVVDKGWYEDFNKIFYDTDDYIYGSKNSGYTVEELKKSNRNFVYFASMQDLRGSDIVGGKFDKNNAVFETVWDFVIVDEAHEGTTTALGNEVIKATVKEELNYTKFLALSGTPFNILNDYDDNIYTWDYIMEQRSKNTWDELHFGDSNPYAELPELNIYTYDLGQLINNSIYQELEDKAFNFREFFRVWTGDMRLDRRPIPENAKIGNFIHKEDVWSFLNLITKKDDQSRFPYSTEEFRDLFRHSLWMVPGVKEAKALSKLMKAHPIFGNGAFDIVNVAGDGDEEEKYEDALDKVQKAIKSTGEGGYTITLSCGRLTTGVTVPEWTAVFYLAGSFSTSATNYLQTIFRVQSPCNKDGKIKTSAYVFDFAPDRTLKMVAESVAISTKAGKTDKSDRAILGDFLNYCPVIAVDGTRMKEYDTNRLLQQLKRAYAERAVKNGFDDHNLYNDELLKLDNIELERFKNLKGIIGTTKSSHKTNEIDINRQGFTDEEYEEIERIKKKPPRIRTPEEEAKLKEDKEKRKQARDARSILRGISIRMPLLIYGADIDFNEDITMEMLVKIVDDSSWEEFMPQGVTKEIFKQFVKYYDHDIFVAAGRKIRDITKGADKLPQKERINQIAGLFMNFKNPDKETVLTPWRVVNMHLGDSLGGYNFFDKNYEETLEEPRYISHGEVTETTLSNPNSKILEINSKTGLYPLYAAYSIFRNKCDQYLENELTDSLEEKLWEKTVLNNIFVICKTPMAKAITRRTLVGYKSISPNTTYFDELNNMMKNKSRQLVDKVTRPSYWKIKGEVKMKFDAVVGNPPYQETSLNTSDPPVYHLFMDSAFKLSDKVTFITPARFLFNAGKTPKAWNKRVLNDEHFKVIWYKPNSSDVFPNTDIKGGVAVTFRDTNQIFGKIGTYSIHEELNSILSKVLNYNYFEPISSIIYPPNKFNLNILYNDFPQLKNIIGSGGREKRLTTPIFEQLDIFEDAKTNDNQVKIFGLINNNRFTKYIDSKYLEHNDSFNKYKVIISRSNGTGLLGETLSTPRIGFPKVGNTQSFISIGAFGSLGEAEALLKYIKSKFARCMLGTLKVTQHNNINTWENVPIQNFTAESDIAWNKSIKEIDAQLYNKYGLDEKEIEFIEEKIQEMK